jgi:hypothetical protein
MKQSKINCRGKTESNFLVNAYFICADASMIAVMLRDITKILPVHFTTA